MSAKPRKKSAKAPGPSAGGPQTKLIRYQTEDGRTRIECRFENETLWLTQAQIAELFQVTVPTVNEHLKGIYAEGELPGRPTIRKFRIVRFEGIRQVSRKVESRACGMKRLQAKTAAGILKKEQRIMEFTGNLAKLPGQVAS